MSGFSLYGLSSHDLLITLGLSKTYQGKQVYSWLTQGVYSFEAMTNLPKSLRETLKEKFPETMATKVVAISGENSEAVKLAIELHDGAIIECVMLCDREGRKTACLSSQVGCAMGCTFCKTATMGIVRNLTSVEIIEQFIHLMKFGEISNIVFMGMGEPLSNLQEVIAAIEYLHNPEGIDMGLRRITLSTCGVVPGIKKLTELKIPVRLAVSLVAADNALRSKLMPVNDRWPLNELKSALVHYQHALGKRFTLEYCMLSEINTDMSAAKKLAHFMKDLHAVVNLIAWNEAEGLPYRSPSEQEIASFCQYLDDLKLPWTRRLSKGRNVDGACGQLATKVASH